MKRTYIMAQLARIVGSLWGIMALAVIAGIAGHLAAIAVPVLGIAAALSVAGFDFLPDAGALLTALAICAGARGILHYLEQIANHYIAFKLLARIRDRVFAALRALAPAKLAGRNRGDLISVITGDIELLEVFYAHTISPIAIALGVSAVVITLQALIHPVFAAIAATAFATMGIAVPLIANRASGNTGRAFRDQLGALDSHLLDSLRGMRDAMQYGVARERGEAFFRHSRELGRREAALKRRAATNQAAAALAVWAFDLALAITGLHLFYYQQIPLAAMLIGVVLMMSSFGPVLALANLGTGLQQTFAAGERVIELLHEEPVVSANTSGEAPHSAAAAAREVSFSYGADQVLQHVSLAVRPGSILGLSGRSGSGKSTLLALMMRFWDVDEGRIEIGDVDVRALGTHALRRHESLVEQTTHLFNASIADNIRIARLDATDEEVRAAASATRIHDTIASWPQGYDTPAGELGDRLSAGERQRIGIARALLRDAPIILLDEPTSNLDSLNEAAILRVLADQRGSRTVVLVSHRPSTMRIADTVISLEHGRVS